MPGSLVRTSCRARGPPVEVPMATIQSSTPEIALETEVVLVILGAALSTVRTFSTISGFSGAAGAVRSGSITGFTAATVARKRLPLTPAASRHFCSKSFSISSIREIEPALLATKSTAPRLNALIVASAPALVRLLTITTGVGFTAMICSSAVKPSITGISTSSVTTSGECCLTFSTASAPFLPMSTTSKSG